jgi:hypothetical protein
MWIRKLHQTQNVCSSAGTFIDGSEHGTSEGRIGIA